MLNNLKYFKGSALVTVAGLVAAFFLNGMSAVFIVAILAVLEVSLSFDNAVVNATVLKDMDDKWRHRFLTWGMIIAVFGMRILFPLLIVGVVAHINPLQALDLAMHQPDKYAAYMAKSHVMVSAFGGAFLMMVGLKYFFDEEKDVHWVSFIEAPLVKLGKMEGVTIALTLLLLYLTTQYLEEAKRLEFVIAGMMGIITYIIVDGFGSFMESTEESMHASVAEGAVKSGLALFLYLEVLDASFSFDGVIGAFAITNNLFIIGIGLGIGAMFVRSLTILLVERGTLSEYKYLEHGAFYAIFALASIMFIKSFHEVPEVITGLIGAGFIGLAFVASLLSKDDDDEESAESND